MTRYVKLKGGTILEVVRQNDKLVSGYRVNRHGTRIERENATGVTQFLHVATPAEITAELVMNLHYATLEPKP